MIIRREADEEGVFGAYTQTQIHHLLLLPDDDDDGINGL